MCTQETAGITRASQSVFMTRSARLVTSYGCDSADPASVCTQHSGPQEGVLCTPSFQRTHRGQAGGHLRPAPGMCSVYRGARLGLGVGETVTELTEQEPGRAPQAETSALTPPPGPGRTACDGAGLRGHFCPQLILTTSGVRARGRLFQGLGGGGGLHPAAAQGPSLWLPHTRSGQGLK